jgi:adenosine deaminase
VTEALIDAFKQGQQRWDIMARLIPAINREKSPEEAVSMVKQVIANPYPEVLGIGIDYNEHNAPIEHFWKAYRLAKQHGLKLTGHCSEFGLHWRNVETGVTLIALDRVDHGYSIIDNPILMQHYAAQGIPFTVAPSNTFFLKKWPDIDQWRNLHPIRAMAKAGMTIIPATDDWHMHNTNGFECYRVFIEEFGFDLDGIKQMMLNGIQAAWITSELKAQWSISWGNAFDNLRENLLEEPQHSEEKHLRYSLARIT